MQKAMVVCSMLLLPPVLARAQVGVSIGLPGVSIGINVPVYPELVLVPGHPVYYDPGASANYFFYDGFYWVYQGDNWYASSWYDGPWDLVRPEVVPLFVLRVPVRYYRRPPPYFGGWRADAPPRWGERWGPRWEARRRGWDRWDRRAVPRPAPLPVYQRQYAGDRYPRAAEQQRAIRAQSYRHRPQDPATRQRSGWRSEPNRAAPAPRADRAVRPGGPGPRVERREGKATPGREREKAPRGGHEGNGRGRDRQR
jgi:hypothetical protein